MTFEELEKMAAQGEGLELEFKRKLPEDEKLAREAVALGNARGGWILIGVDDDGEIAGLKDPYEAEQVFAQVATELISPPLRYSAYEVPVSPKKSVVVIRIPVGKSLPYLVLPAHGNSSQQKSSKKGIAYYRVADKSIKASTELFFILKGTQQKEGTRFQFGEKEKKLVEYLEDGKKITLGEYRELAGLNSFKASKTLVTLVNANVLRIHPGEDVDYFSLANDAFAEGA